MSQMKEDYAAVNCIQYEIRKDKTINRKFRNKFMIGLNCVFCLVKQISMCEGPIFQMIVYEGLFFKHYTRLIFYMHNESCFQSML